MTTSFNQLFNQLEMMNVNTTQDKIVKSMYKSFNTTITS